MKEIELINRGGFGEIHKVQLANGEVYARKTFRPSKNYDKRNKDKFRRRFVREVKVQERLPSDLFIPILDSSLDIDSPWFLMPLADKVFKHEINTLTGKVAAEALSDILNSLEHLHQLNLIHRDLKPGNILFHNGRWKLADLGLITADNEMSSSSTITSSDEWAGSQGYMAPEQHTNFHGVTPKADIYSFGAILHDIYNRSKRVPFEKLTASGHIGTIIEKCTEKDPANRFDSISALRNALLSHLFKQDVAPTIGAETRIWKEQLSQVSNWNKSKFDSFVIYTRRNKNSVELLFREITSQSIEYLFQLEISIWKDFIMQYILWIHSGRFNFNYCDVLISHLFSAYKLTDDLEIKANAALAAAQLGHSHNRYYVMRFVIKMCSPDISEKLAERMAIEIYVEGVNSKISFLSCAESISLSLSSYHPKIQTALNST